MFTSLGHAEDRVDTFSLDNTRNRIIWGVLAFQGGWLNAGGFLATHRFVSHVTGFATQFGYDMAKSNWIEASGMLMVPIFFLIGSMISGFYVDREITAGKKPKYHILFFLIFFFLLIVLILGSLNLFGEFGTNATTDQDVKTNVILLSLLCLSCGLQNAGITTASNNFVRTTHLTGMTTDLGIGLVRMTSEISTARKKMELNKSQIRVILILCFVFGSMVASFFFIQWRFLGFIIPCLISLGLYKIAFNLWKKNA